MSVCLSVSHFFRCANLCARSLHAHTHILVINNIKNKKYFSQFVSLDCSNSNISSNSSRSYCFYCCCCI